MEMDARRLAEEIASLKKAVRDLQLAAQMSHTSVEGGAVEVYDDDDNLRQIVGLQEDSTFTIRDVNAPPPAIPPAMPTVMGGAGVLVVSSYGLTVDGSEWPLDFDHIAVHVGTSAGFIPSVATKMAEFGKAGGSVTIALDAGTYYVVLVAVNTSGYESVPSTEVAEAVLAPTTGSGGIATYHTPDAPIGLTVADMGCLWYDTDNGNLVSRWDGSAWVSLAVGTGGIEPGAVDGTRLSLDALDARTVNGMTINGGTINGGTFTTDDGTSDAYWYITSFLGDNNLIRGKTGLVIGGTPRDAEFQISTNPDLGDGRGRSADLYLLAPILGDFGGGTHPRAFISMNNYEFDPGGTDRATIRFESEAFVFADGYNGAGSAYVEFNPLVYFNDGVTCYDSLYAGTTLHVVGSTTLDSTLDVTGAVDLASDLTVAGTLTATGASHLYGLTTIEGLVVPAGYNIIAGGDASIGGDLTVTGMVNEEGCPFGSRYLTSGFSTGGEDVLLGSSVAMEGGMTYDSGTGEFIVPVDGLYQYATQVNFSNDGSGVGYLAINQHVNGTSQAASRQPNAGTYTGLFIDKFYRLSAGDRVKFAVNPSNSTITVRGGDSETWAVLKRVGA